MLSTNIWRILSFSTRTVAGRSGCNKTRKMGKKTATKKIPNNHKPNAHTKVVFGHYKLFLQFECFEHVCWNSHTLCHTGILRKVLIMNTCPCLKKEIDHLFEKYFCCILDQWCWHDFTFKFISVRVKVTISNYNFTNNYSLQTQSRVCGCQYYLNLFSNISFVIMLEDLRVHICRCLFGHY